ncbi:MAG: PD40 domain-containing protein [Bacteroidales bacterium]|nr:PD40 domain-containing protein [Bacteroidales bacterium]
MKNRLLLVLFVLVIGYNNSYSQSTDEELFYMAENLVDKENYDGALEIFKKLLRKDPMNANLNFKVGYCYLQSVLQKDQAIGYLEVAINSTSDEYNPDDFNEKNAPTEAYLFLGKAYHVNYRFDEAIGIYNELKAKLANDGSEFHSEINRAIEICEHGKELVKYPVNMIVTNLGNGINSELDEHSPVFSADESVLIYTSKRGMNPEDPKTDDGQYFEDIYISYKDGDIWKSPSPIGKNINTSGHEASIGLSVDGQQLFIYKDDKNDGNIYLSTLEGEDWTKPTKLPFPINTKSKETHASLSADGRSLYFTSDRKGGLGGLDIYVIRKLPNGSWGDAMNLGPTINTPYDEEGPFIHPDGVTLFFSSIGHNSMGGFDIFFSSNEDGSWSKPSNIGYPINTTEDDVFYTPTPDGKRAYYASHQTGGIGKNDIYLISIPGSQVKPLTVMTGNVLLADGRDPEGITITVTDLETQELVGIYTPNSKTGKFLFILSPGKKYNVFVEADEHLFHTENLVVPDNTSYQEIKRAIKLQPIVLGQTKKVYYIEFPEGSSKIDESAQIVLSNLNDFLQKNPSLIVDISGSKTKEIELLTKERKDVVSNDLSEKGIQQSRILQDLSGASIEDNIIQLIILDTESQQLADNQSNTTDENSDNNNTNNQSDNNNQDNIGNDNQNTEDQNNNTDNQSDQNINNDNNDVNQTESDVNQNSKNTDAVVNEIMFDFNQFVTDEYFNELNALSNYLKYNKTAVIELIGHTDLQGDESYNLWLGEKRAEFVKKYLVERGAEAKNIRIKTLGETKPISIDSSPATRKYNRRVEITIIKQGDSKLSIEKIKVPKGYKIKG